MQLPKFRIGKYPQMINRYYYIAFLTNHSKMNNGTRKILTFLVDGVLLVVLDFITFCPVIFPTVSRICLTFVSCNNFQDDVFYGNFE